jgi:hypothetical protein
VPSDVAAECVSKRCQIDKAVGRLKKEN